MEEQAQEFSISLWQALAIFCTYLVFKWKITDLKPWTPARRHLLHCRAVSPALKAVLLKKVSFLQRPDLLITVSSSSTEQQLQSQMRSKKIEPSQLIVLSESAQLKEGTFQSSKGEGGTLLWTVGPCDRGQECERVVEQLLAKC